MNLPKISVVTITYGHENYILDTLKGVINQDYGGEIEFIISNDNSPDETDAVIKEFLTNSIIPPNISIKYIRHEINKGMIPNFVWALNQSSGEYISICEGDDYWTDNLKLSKQAMFLDSSPDFMGCAHQSTIIENGEEIRKFRESVKEVLKVDDLLEGRLFHTATLMFRRQILQYFNPIANNILSGDRLLNLCIASKGKIFFSQEDMCMYRRHLEGISTTVKVKDLLKDLNSLKGLKALNSNFPVLRYKAYIFLTVALCKEANKIERMYFLFLFGVLALFNLPHYFRRFVNVSLQYEK